MRWVVLMRLMVAMLVGTSSAEPVLRIAKVLPEGSENVDRLELHNDDGESEQLFISRDAVITDRDVEDAWPEVMGKTYQLGLKLKPEGGKKMQAATKNMKFGVDRMAVILEGELVWAPVVQMELSRSLVITLSDVGFDEVAEVGRKILGLPPSEKRDDGPPPVLPEMRPYTEEEYQELKQQRSLMGIHYLDELPSEESLDQWVKDAATEQEIIERLGPPTFQSKELNRLSYDLAPERRPMPKEGKMNRSGFALWFEDGKLASWRDVFFNMGPELRPVNLSPRLLKATVPKFDFNEDELDVITPIEQVRIPDLHQKVTRGDLYDVLSLLSIALQQALLEEEPPRDMKSDCDALKFLAIHFPELGEAVREKSKDKRIALTDLSELLRPYMTGEKEVHDPAAASE